MQAVRSGAILFPLQIGLAIQIHRQYGSRYLVDVLDKLRFCSSYSEVKKYERNAAFHHGTYILGTSLERFHAQTIHKGNHPGQSSIIFMPMIDMKATDDTCILSTMHFVATQTQKYNVYPIFTFAQPLYQKSK